MIHLKSSDEIDAIGKAGQVVAAAHQYVRSLIQPGVETRVLDAAAEKFLDSRNAIAIFKGLPGPTPFPNAICLSINEELTAGLPSDRQLAAGDLVSVDIGCRLNGWCADAAWTYAVGKDAAGEGGETNQRLIETGRRLIEIAIQRMAMAASWCEVAKHMQTFLANTEFQLVSGLNGHGIGRQLHEDPLVVHAAVDLTDQTDFPLVPGTVFTIEPVLTSGVGEFRLHGNRWTTSTRDSQPGAHFEHTVAVTQNGPRVLTVGVGEENGG